MTALALLVLCCLGGLALMACSVSFLRPYLGTGAQGALTLLPLLVMAAVLLSGPAAPGAGLSTGSPAAPGARSYRVTLAGLRLRLTAGEQAAIGGDAQQDQLYVPELPAHLLTLRSVPAAMAAGHSAGPSANNSGRLELAPPAEDDSGVSGEEPSLDGNPLGLVVYRDPGAARAHRGLAGTDPDFGGTLFAPGSWLCEPDRAGHCDASVPMLTWALHNGTVQLLGPKTRLCPLTRSAQRPPPTRSIYPLAAFAREGCQGEKPFSWDALEPAADFLYWGTDHQLYVRANGHTPLIVVAGDGRAVRVEAGRRQLAPGTALQVHLYRYELSRELPAAPEPAAATQPASSARRALAGVGLFGQSAADGVGRDAAYTRLTERRSFQLRALRDSDAGSDAASGGVELLLDTPEQHEISLDNDQDALSLVSQPATPAALTTVRGALGFRAIGGPLAAHLPNTIERLLLPEDGRRFCGRSAPDMLLVQGPAGASCAELGRWFLLGDPERFQVKLRIAPLGRPAGWIWALGLVALTNLLIRQWLQVSAAQSVTLGFVELFLTLRVLVAFDAAALDWRAEGAVAHAWLALLWVPLPFELVPVARVPALRAAVLRCMKLLFVGAATVFIAQAQGAFTDGHLGASALSSGARLLDTHEGPAAVLLVALLLTVAIGALTRVHGQALWEAAVIRPAQALLRRVRPAAGPLRPWAPVLAPLIAVTLLHLVLVLVGFREQLAGVRISAFMVPLLVLGWASLDQGVVARYGSGSSQAPQPGSLMALGLALLPFAPWLVFHLAHDNGAYVYFLAPAVLMIWGPALRGGAWLTVSLLALALVSGAVAYLGLNPVFRGIGVPAAVLAVVTVAGLAAVMRATRSGRLPQTWRPLPLLTALLLVLALHGVGFWAAGQSAAPPQDASADLTPMSTAAMQGARVPANLIRIMNQAVPEAVELLGTREGYEQRGAMLEMIDFAASLTGRGWPQSTAPQELRGTHVNDTVTAVHILSPFGRLCGIGIALFLMAFVAAVAGLTALNDRASSLCDAGRARRAALAALVLASTSLYMLLANIGAVPFTGRNFYFLSVLSQSDLLEGGLLLVIILAATLPKQKGDTGADPGAAQRSERAAGALEVAR